MLVLADSQLAVVIVACLLLGVAVAALLERRRVVAMMRPLVMAIQALASSAGAQSQSAAPASVDTLIDAVEISGSRFADRLAKAQSERDDLLAVLSAITDGVVVTDSHGTVVFVNRVELARQHLPESRVLGRSFIEVVRDHEMHQLFRQCMATRTEQTGMIESVPGRNFLKVTASPVGLDGGCVVVLQDVTELRRLERVRREFVANISHELRTPLASLKLLAETLEGDGAEEPALVQDYSHRIEVEVDRVAQMVEELGELSLVESGQVTFSREPVNIAALVARAVERLDAQAARAGLHIEVDVPVDLPEPGGDERRLEQVVVSLIHNAIKFTPAGGTIVVRARVEVPGRLTVSVTDTGVGIAPDDLNRIFERFYKADKSRSSKGTGLGLAIARHIIEMHHGALWADSVQGKGSTFSFYLPLSTI